MAFTLAMFDKSYEYIGPRLAPLGLDLTVATFDKDGVFHVGGQRRTPAEMDIDFCWLTTHINAGGFRDKAFDMLLGCRSIGVLQTFNAGLDHPFYARIAAKGTRICNSSAQGIAIAEYCIGQVMAVLQPIEAQRQAQARKEWKPTPFREISDTHWLIVGHGPIGEALAKRVKAFEAAVTVVRRSRGALAHADRVGMQADLPAFLPDADVIVLACPLTAETREMANAAFFARVKHGAILVNIARGALVADGALLAALEAGHPATAVLDVFHEEPLPASSSLWTHPGVRLTAHTSFFGSGGRARWDQLFLDNILRFAKGEPLLREVNPKDVV